MGTSKMDRRDQELLDKQMRRLTPPRNDGAIAVMLAAMFLIGITVGGLLSTHQSESTQITTMGAGLRLFERDFHSATCAQSPWTSGFVRMASNLCPSDAPAIFTFIWSPW
jgi:hypothetical protein